MKVLLPLFAVIGVTFHDCKGTSVCNSRQPNLVFPFVAAKDGRESTTIVDHFEKFRRRILRASIAGTLCLSLSTPINLMPCYGDSIVWTDRNRLAAETWKAVDEGYLDRTFGGQDWFAMRQSVVKKNYKSDEELYQSLSAMLSKLGDKYTRFLTPAQYDALLSSATGQLIGIGMELEVLTPASAEGVTVVARTEEGSPAQEAGLLQGDVIVNVDGTPANKLSPEEIAVLSRGKEGTKVSLQVSRGGKLVDIRAVRRPLTLQGGSFGTFQLEPSKMGPKMDIDGDGKVRVGVVKIRSFSSTTSEEVTRALESMHKYYSMTGPGLGVMMITSSLTSREGNALDLLVFDLRNNGGGLLQGAVDTSSLLLNPGRIVVFVVGRDGQVGGVQALQTLPSSVRSNDPNLPDLTTPVYIFVNSNTASAAEVFAAGLKENDRPGSVKLVGEKTFGKGIIQNLQQLRDGAGLAVTVARYETPQHHNINKVGIEVDVPIACEPAQSVQECLSRLSP